MAKKKFQAAPYLYPMPITIVGTRIDNNPHYMTASFNGIVSFKPTRVIISISKSKSTNAAIRKNRTFSINLPSEELLKETDYVGGPGKIIPRKDVFTSFYGDLNTAPLIVEAPISAECELEKSIDLGDFDIHIGKVVAVYADDSVIDKEQPLPEKGNPIFFTYPSNEYWALGKSLGKGWKEGLSYSGKS